MLERLLAIEDHYRELESMLGDPELLADVERWQKMNRELSQLSPIVEKVRDYRRVTKEIEDDEAVLADSDDAELKSLAAEELSSLREEKAALEKEFPILLLPKDPNDDKSVIVEIRGGVGGEEAALFAGDLFRMYTRYAEKQGWRVSIIDSSPTELGGFKEISFSVDGAGAFSRLKYERGTHRVQRVPETESQGRIHTSAVTVAVLPEADDVEVDIKNEDLKIDTYRAGGAGGQYVNKTESAIRITHLPTGIVVQCQDEKSQLKNKEKAMRVLRARILEQAQEQQAAEEAADRKSQIGSGDRSERIRTYNFPQNRLTDHRVDLTLYSLDRIIEGNLDPVLDALREKDVSERIAAALK